MAVAAAVSRENAHFVRHVVRPANVLEIGTDVGGLFHVLHHLCAGKCLSVSLPGGPWGSLSLRGGVRRALELTLRYPRAHVVVGDSHDPESLALLRDMLGGESLDLLFIDGDHTEEGVLEDFRTYAPLVRPGGWICLHDIKESQFHRRHGCFVSDANHRYDDRNRPVPWQGFTSKGPTRVGDNVWCGANVVIASGVEVGERSVIGANSVVTSDIPAFSVAAGVPARVLQTIEY